MLKFIGETNYQMIKFKKYAMIIQYPSSDSIKVYPIPKVMELQVEAHYLN